MSSHVKVSGAWRDVSTIHVKVSGAWRQVLDGWVRIGGVWKQVYTALAAVLDSTNYSASEASGGFPATASVFPSVSVTGQSPFTYLWVVTGAYSSLAGQGTANLTIRLTSTDAIASGTVKCTVTDSLGNSVDSNTATWDLEVSPLE